MKHIKTIEEMLLTEVINKQDKELNKHLHPEMYTDKDSFLKYARKRKKELGKIDPSTEFQFIRYVDEEWCVHFTGRNKVSEIVKNGFKYGTSEVTSVPYGSGTKSGEKGYNYAFLASDICSTDISSPLATVSASSATFCMASSAFCTQASTSGKFPSSTTSDSY